MWDSRSQCLSYSKSLAHLGNGKKVTEEQGQGGEMEIRLGKGRGLVSKLGSGAFERSSQTTRHHWG